MESQTRTPSPAGPGPTVDPGGSATALEERVEAPPPAEPTAEPAGEELFLTLGQAAKLVGVSERALRKRVYKGTLPTRREVRGGRAVVVVASADLVRLFPEADQALEGPEPSGSESGRSGTSALPPRAPRPGGAPPAVPLARPGAEAAAGSLRPRRRKADLQRLAAERDKRRGAEREAAEMRGRLAAVDAEVERLQGELSAARRTVHEAQEDRGHLERALGEAQERVRHLEERNSRLPKLAAGLATAEEVDRATRRWRLGAWLAGAALVVLAAWVLGREIAARRSAGAAGGLSGHAPAVLEERAG